MTPPVLWHLPISHFNEKVRWALDWKRVPHVREALGPAYLPRALWATGQPRLPILFLDGRAIADSTRILAALEDRFPDPPLVPADPEARRRALALALEDFLDEELGPPLRTAILGPVFARDPAAAMGIVMTGMAVPAAGLLRVAAPAFRAYYRHRHAINDATIAASRGHVATALDRIERELGGREYLVGDRFTVADLTAAALLSVIVLPPEMQYPPAPIPAEMAEYGAALAARPAIAWAREMYRRHRGRSSEIGTTP